MSKTNRLFCVSLNNILKDIRTSYPDAYLQYTYLDKKHKHSHAAAFENDLISNNVKEYVYVLMTLTRGNCYVPKYVGNTASLLYTQCGSEIKFDGKEGVKKFNTGFRKRVRPIDTSMIIVIPCSDSEMVQNCKSNISKLLKCEEV